VSSPDPESILVVDDDPLVLESTCAYLSSRGFTAIPCGEPASVGQMLRKGDFDVVLTDFKMPGMTGLELLDSVRSSHPDLPVVLMTAFADLDLAVEAITRGAFGFLLKPCKPDYLAITLKKAAQFHSLLRIEKGYKKTLEDTVEMRTRELADALRMVTGLSKEIVQRLTIVTEFRDSDTGAHVVRIGLFVRCLAEAMSLPADFVDTISFASPMHDIGKVVIPDSILLKPGPLTPEEFAIMKTHPVIGEKILAGSGHPSLQMAASIARNHHEKHDGSGYPSGLKGESVPLEARIVILCDQYDALTSKRPYKEAFSHDEAVRIICQGDGRTLPSHFHPRVLETFIAVADEMQVIRAGHI